MSRFLKWALTIVAVVAALCTMSYAGARVTAGKILGSEPPVRGRTVQFDWDGVDRLPGRPRAWVISYHTNHMPGVGSVEIIVSPTGKLLATRPPNLDELIETWNRDRLP